MVKSSTTSATAELSSTQVVQKKSTKKTSKQQQEETVVVPTQEAPKEAPKEEKKSSKKKVAASAVVVKEETELPSLDGQTTDLASLVKSMDMTAKLSALTTILSSLKAEHKNREREFSKELKQVAKSAKKRRQTNGLSGFNKPIPISEELSTFLNLPVGELASRSYVTKAINAYIAENKLQNEKSRRNIIPNEALTKLLKFPADGSLDYLNLQKFLGPHFKPAVAPVSV